MRLVGLSGSVEGLLLSKNTVTWRVIWKDQIISILFVDFQPKINEYRTRKTVIF